MSKRQCWGLTQGLSACKQEEQDACTITSCAKAADAPRVTQGRTYGLKEGAVDRLNDLPLIPNTGEPLQPLRALRLWHWRHARAATAKREDGRASRHTQELARQSWNFHMGAVQALNDLFPIGDTAERDDQPGRRVDEVLPFKVPA